MAARVSPALVFETTRGGGDLGARNVTFLLGVNFARGEATRLSPSSQGFVTGLLNPPGGGTRQKKP